MGNVFDTILRTAKDYSQDLKKVFFESGNLGYAKFALASYVSLMLANYVLKHNGWLPKKSVKGDHIFITGAGSGIGAAMALKFAKLGAKISVVDINLESAQKTVEQIKAAGGEAKAIYCNVALADSVKDAAEQAVEGFGDVDILINNAGIVNGKKLLDTDEKSIERTLLINTVSHGYTVKQFLPKMLEKDKGHIVTIASCAGLVGVAGLGDYCASKFGAFGFDEALRMELRKLNSKVQTTCICPYFIDTGMFAGVKTRIGLLLPILKTDWMAQRIVNAVRQDEKVVIAPTFCNFVFLLRAFLPVTWCDTAQEILGTNASMDHFTGRQTK